MRKKVLLTGATGFLGSHLLESFISQEFDVSILKRSISDTWRINDLLGKCKTYDIDKMSLESIFNKVEPELLVHTACSYGRKNESIIEIINSNLIFGIALLEQSIKNNVRTFINTDTQLPRNINEYSLSKAQFTDWLELHSNQIQVFNFKIEHLYGVKDDNKKFIPWLINEMINSDDIIQLTSGIQKRDFIYVTDVVEAYNLIIHKSKLLLDWNEFYIGTNSLIEVREFIIAIAKLLEKKYGKAILPRLNFGSVQYRKNDIMTPKSDNSSLINLGWKCNVTFDDGIRRILNDY